MFSSTALLQRYGVSTVPRWSYCCQIPIVAAPEARVIQRQSKAYVSYLTKSSYSASCSFRLVSRLLLCLGFLLHGFSFSMAKELFPPCSRFYGNNCILLIFSCHAKIADYHKVVVKNHHPAALLEWIVGYSTRVGWAQTRRWKKLFISIPDLLSLCTYSRPLFHAGSVLIDVPFPSWRPKHNNYHGD